MPKSSASRFRRSFLARKKALTRRLDRDEEIELDSLDPDVVRQKVQDDKLPKGIVQGGLNYQPDSPVPGPSGS